MVALAGIGISGAVSVGFADVPLLVNPKKMAQPIFAFLFVAEFGSGQFVCSMERFESRAKRGGIQGRIPGC
jgi:hypothetical protein